MEKTENRIKLTDGIKDILFKMTEGNIGAMVALTSVLSSIGKPYRLDPLSAFGGVGVLLSLDSNGIYGHYIHCFYKDICEQNFALMNLLLRAVQLGHLSSNALHHAIHRPKRDGKNLLDIEKYAKQVFDSLNYDFDLDKELPLKYQHKNPQQHEK